MYVSELPAVLLAGLHTIVSVKTWFRTYIMPSDPCSNSVNICARDRHV
jgi:hypothetical protein